MFLCISLDMYTDGAVLTWQGVLEGLKDADGVPEEDVAPGSLRVTLHPYQRHALGWVPRLFIINVYKDGCKFCPAAGSLPTALESTVQHEELLISYLLEVLMPLVAVQMDEEAGGPRALQGCLRRHLGR